MALIFRRPLHEIALWPAAELQVIRAYMAKRPPVEIRIESAIAVGQAMYANRFKQSSDAPSSPSEFLTFKDGWEEPAADQTDYAKANREMLKAFASIRPRKASK